MLRVKGKQQFQARKAHQNPRVPQLIHHKTGKLVQGWAGLIADTSYSFKGRSAEASRSRLHTGNLEVRPHHTQQETGHCAQQEWKGAWWGKPANAEGQKTEKEILAKQVATSMHMVGVLWEGLLRTDT